jgi:hypothetical protein
MNGLVGRDNELITYKPCAVDSIVQIFLILVCELALSHFEPIFRFILAHSFRFYSRATFLYCQRIFRLLKAVRALNLGLVVQPEEIFRRLARNFRLRHTTQLR